MPGYRYTVDDTVLETFSGLAEDERTQLLAIFQRLAAQPERPWAYQTKAPSGREYRAQFFGDWLIRYWVDSPVRQVVIVEVRWT